MMQIIVSISRKATIRHRATAMRHAHCGEITGLAAFMSELAGYVIKNSRPPFFPKRIAAQIRCKPVSMIALLCLVQVHKCVCECCLFGRPK